MQTDYDQIAAQYKRAKRQPWRLHIEHFTFFELLGDLRGKSVLDLACGEGYHTRFLKRAGAGRVLGVDQSEGMIRLAREEEAREPLGIEYQVHDAADLQLGESFDLVTAGYLLNYARTRDELLTLCRACARPLRPGGRFVTVNNNPAQPAEAFASTRKYGLTKGATGELREEVPVTCTLYLDEGPLELVNYHLSTVTHEWALHEAGFKTVRWHAPRVSPAGIQEFGADYWSDFLANPPVIFLECSL
jgi:ubiquinone/menaquinone biosynthesis C-methylase UbiE